MEYKDFEKAPWIVCSNGDVISKKMNKPKKCALNNVGYKVVTYGGKSYFVHRLVAELFIRPIPKGMVVNHKDGNKLNNDVSNLEIVTYSQNEKHAYDMGLKKGNVGETNPLSKLTNIQARNLIEDIINGKTNKELGAIYGLHPQYVSLVRHKRRWKQVWRLVEGATTTETKCMTR